jgi:hypothetical protein
VHPDVAQAVVFGRFVAERVAQNADERNVGVCVVRESVETSEDGQEFRAARDRDAFETEAGRLRLG